MCTKLISGESIEDAGKREVFEESGIHVTDIHFDSSQPFPITGALMLACMGRATNTDIKVCRNGKTLIIEYLISKSIKFKLPQKIHHGNYLLVYLSILSKKFAVQCLHR